MDRLPPLRLLSTFETMARLGSMREAAARLNVTQPAVSQALRQLEEHVGAPLIDRTRRPAGLTPAGDILARAVRSGLGQISAAIEDIRVLDGSDEAQVTVSCTLGMATYWLMPRLPLFYADHPEVTVNVQAPATDLPVLAPGIDVALRYGTARDASGWREGATQLLFPETLCPVGSPDLVARLLASGVDLDAAPLIHVRSPHNVHWAGWEDYLLRRGITRPRLSGQSFNNYVQAAQAVHDGRGLMLGWRSITGRAEAEGTLTPWPGGALDLGTAYYVTAAELLSAPAAAFHDWVLSVADQ